MFHHNIVVVSFYDRDWPQWRLLCLSSPIKESNAHMDKGMLIVGVREILRDGSDLLYIMKLLSIYLSIVKVRWQKWCVVKRRFTQAGEVVRIKIIALINDKIVPNSCIIL